jgi:excisionase family DNA binding protein
MVSTVSAPIQPTSIYGASRYFQVSERTIERWIAVGHIVGWQDGKSVLVDVAEIERALLNNKGMRDGRRKPFGPAARIMPMPRAVEQ